MRNRGRDPCGVRTHDPEVAKQTPYQLGHRTPFNILRYGLLSTNSGAQYGNVLTALRLQHSCYINRLYQRNKKKQTESKTEQNIKKLDDINNFFLTETN